MKTPAEILRELVAIPSVSSLSNRPLAAHILAHFEPLGWHAQEFSYRDEQNVEKVNLLLSPEPFPRGAVRAELAVVCHTDTVPFSHLWTDATTLREAEGALHGCGACDVKGFLACMLAAAQRLNAQQLRHMPIFVFTADEEIGCRGARFLFEQGVARFHYAIVGEPTSLQPARAGKGYCLAEVRVRGRAAHSAHPEQGRSAIFAAAEFLQQIEALSKALEADRDDLFAPAWTTVNVGTIKGGSAKNVVPAECSFLVEWRPIPAQSPEFVAESLRGIASSMSRDGIEADVTVLRIDAGFHTPADSLVLAALASGSDSAAIAVPFGTEAPWLTRMGAETVVIGPGSMLTAHSPRECVPIEELNRCVDMLCTAIQQLCG